MQFAHTDSIIERKSPVNFVATNAESWIWHNEFACYRSYFHWSKLMRYKIDKISIEISIHWMKYFLHLILHWFNQKPFCRFTLREFHVKPLLCTLFDDLSTGNKIKIWLTSDVLCTYLSTYLEEILQRISNSLDASPLAEKCRKNRSHGCIRCVKTAGQLPLTIVARPDNSREPSLLVQNAEEVRILGHRTVQIN